MACALNAEAKSVFEALSTKSPRKVPFAVILVRLFLFSYTRSAAEALDPVDHLIPLPMPVNRTLLTLCVAFLLLVSHTTAQESEQCKPVRDCLDSYWFVTYGLMVNSIILFTFAGYF